MYAAVALYLAVVEAGLVYGVDGASRRPRSWPTGRLSDTCSDSDPAHPSSRVATRTVTTGGTRKGPAGCW